MAECGRYQCQPGRRPRLMRGLWRRTKDVHGFGTTGTMRPPRLTVGFMSVAVDPGSAAFTRMANAFQFVGQLNDDHVSCNPKMSIAPGYDEIARARGVTLAAVLGT